MSKLKYLLAFVSAVFLFGCGGGGSSDSPTTPKPEPEPVVTVQDLMQGETALIHTLPNTSWMLRGGGTPLNNSYEEAILEYINKDTLKLDTSVANFGNYVATPVSSSLSFSTDSLIDAGVLMVEEINGENKLVIMVNDDFMFESGGVKSQTKYIKYVINNRVLIDGSYNLIDATVAYTTTENGVESDVKTLELGASTNQVYDSYLNLYYPITIEQGSLQVDNCHVENIMTESIQYLMDFDVDLSDPGHDWFNPADVVVLSEFGEQTLYYADILLTGGCNGVGYIPKMYSSKIGNNYSLNNRTILMYPTETRNTNPSYVIYNNITTWSINGAGTAGNVEVNGLLIPYNASATDKPVPIKWDLGN